MVFDSVLLSSCDTLAKRPFALSSVTTPYRSCLPLAVLRIDEDFFEESIDITDTVPAAVTELLKLTRYLSSKMGVADKYLGHRSTGIVPTPL